MADQILHWGTKDPEAVLNYALNWQRWLQGADAISDAVVTVTDVTLDNTLLTASEVGVVLSGGERGKTAVINIHITTSGGLQDQRTVTLSIDDR